MHIQIRGYKNVVAFDETIEDGKINFISGRSGSGKSAIGQALLQKDPDFNTTVGYTGPTDASIDGVDSLQKKVMKTPLTHNANKALFTSRGSPISFCLDPTF